MATTTRDSDDYFRAGVKFLIILAVLFILSQLVAFAIVYIGDQFMSPAWSERSVPPPKLY